MLDGDESPSVTTTLGAAGACPEVRHAGKVWKVGHPTQAAKTTLEQLAVAAAVSEIEALEGTLSPLSYQKAYRELLAAISAREYKTWGPGWERVVWGPMCSQLFLLSLIRENHQDATEADVVELAAKQPGQVAAALAQVIPNFARLLLSERKDLTPEQQETLLGVLAEQLAPATSQRPPAPIRKTSAASSGSGAKRSRKSRSASILTKSLG